MSNKTSSLYCHPSNDIPIGPVLFLNFGIEICGLDVIPAIDVNSINFFLYEANCSSLWPHFSDEKGVVGKIAIIPFGNDLSISTLRFSLTFELY